MAKLPSPFWAIALNRGAEQSTERTPTFAEVWALFMQRPLHGEYTAQSLDVLELILRNEFDRGGWVALFDQDQLIGWASFFLLNGASLKRIKAHGLKGCIGRRLSLTRGNHLYFSNAVTREGYPLAYRRLRMAAVEKVPHLRSVSFHFVSPRTGEMRWSRRVIASTERNLL